MSGSPHFASVVLDVDSTVAGVEGIDWLAQRRGPVVAARVAQWTASAMAGRQPLEDVFRARLDEVRPSREEVAALARAYRDSIAPGAAASIRALLAAGVRVVLLTGGLREAILPLAAEIGVPPADIHAVGIEFDSAGDYAGFDAAAPTAASQGKRLLVENLQLPRPVLAVGDGITDAELIPSVDAFAAYVGFVRRETVTQRATYILHSFAELEDLVLRGRDPG